MPLPDRPRGDSPSPPPAAPTVARLRLLVRGLVQGVGFRPFTHRLAHELGLSGFVRNAAAGAWIEIEGPRPALETFRRRLASERPPHSAFRHVEESWLDPTGRSGFVIEATDDAGPRTALVLPDLATCPDCLREIFDPANRRYRHPFANCTHCGPRFSIIESLPYDRHRTTLRHFALCPACRHEYEDPADRRFHAQPIACPNCGPQLALLSPNGTPRAARDDALRSAAAALRAGRIVALKGLGGFQLLVRADDPEAVARLRRRKHREAKPLALLCPSLDSARALARLDPAEERLLMSPAAPIVLLEQRVPTSASPIAPGVAAGSPWLGIMLPASPLHHLLLADLGFPVVATSGNVSDDPICTDIQEALDALGAIADLFLVHDRPIARPVDDSVARVILGTEQVLRRARGYAPLPIPVPAVPDASSAPVVLALGGHLKNTIAVARGHEVFSSQHLGDLETAAAAASFVRTTRDLPELLDAQPALLATDLHPDYFPTQHAQRDGRPIVGIQHHEAHAWACLADNDLQPPALALAWDGTGLGHDRTIWGGEFLELTDTDCRRRAWLRPFPLPGGDAAAREGRRSALGLLHAAGRLDDPRAANWLARHFNATELRELTTLLGRPRLVATTSSLGRLFDAVAALLDVRTVSRFEGEAAMDLEKVAWTELRTGRGGPDALEGPGLPVRETDAGLEVDWQPFVESLLAPRAAADDPGPPAVRFHEALARAALDVARRIGQPRVLLTGGCFQNRLLTERVEETLRTGGFSVYWHQRLPPNDGGLAAGQAVAVRRRAALPGPNAPGAG